MMLTAGAEVFGFAHQALLPSLARDVLHTGPEGLGVLSGARSVGGILGLAAAWALGAAAGGAWVVAIGLAPLGQLQIGALASLFGVSVALGVSGLALTMLAGATAPLFPRVKRV